jgi:hypothetical protein
VGDHDAGAAGQQPVRGADHAGLGDGVHPRGRLVEHHQLHVADEQPGEGDQLRLTGRQGGAAGSQQGVQAVRQPGDPVVQPELGNGRLDDGPRHVGEQREVVQQGRGQHVGPLRDDPDDPAQRLQVEVPHVDPAEPDRTAGWFHGA